MHYVVKEYILKFKYIVKYEINTHKFMTSNDACAQNPWVTGVTYTWDHYPRVTLSLGLLYPWYHLIPDVTLSLGSLYPWGHFIPGVTLSTRDYIVPGVTCSWGHCVPRVTLFLWLL